MTTAVTGWSNTEYPLQSVSSIYLWSFESFESTLLLNAFDPSPVGLSLWVKGCGNNAPWSTAGLLNLAHQRQHKSASLSQPNDEAARMTEGAPEDPNQFNHNHCFPSYVNFLIGNKSWQVKQDHLEVLSSCKVPSFTEIPQTLISIN
jgi:hypothetical protein